jgi:N-acetylglucosamine-6-phosphate deacetylase
MSAPRWEGFQRLQDAAGGNIRLVTLAPELPGAVDFVQKLTQSGVCCSIGHSDAPNAVIKDAISAGLKFCTHLGNGAPAEMHRHDNIIERLLAEDDLVAFFIPDGIHLPPWCLKNFFRAKPAGKALFTTDCMAAAGAPAGTFTLGEVTVEVGADRIVRQPGSKGFAGSALAPDEGVDKAADILGINKDLVRHLFSDAVAEHFNIKLPQI